MKDDIKPCLNNTCRTCLVVNSKPHELLSLFESEIFEEINAFHLRISKDDGFPQLICLKCYDTFAYISEFRRQCVENQKRLTDMFAADIDEKPTPCTEEELISFEILIMNSEDEAYEEEKVISNSTERNDIENCDYEYKINNILSEEKIVPKNENEPIYIETRPTSNSAGTLVTDALSDISCKATTSLESKVSRIPISDDFTSRQCNIMSEDVDGFDKHNPTSSKPFRCYTCQVCKRKFSSASNRNAHQYTHNHKNSFNCDICGQKFKSKVYVAKHKRSIHEVGEHECSICNRTFRNSKRYNYHMRSHNPIKKYKCSFCERSFMQQHHMLNHERTHTGLKPYLCNVCGKSFRQETNLKEHLKLHTGERPYECKLCGKNFVQRGVYVMHMRRHDNIRPYQCEICGKNFIQMSSLTIHLRIHTGDRPFKCDLCPKMFAQTHQLKYHKYAAHPNCQSDASEKNPKAKQSINESLNHLKEQECITENTESPKESTHLNYYPYSCPVCSRGFKLPSSLKSHLKCHSEDRKHACKDCGNTFKRAEHLRVHINGVHLKKKPYACNYCGKTFSQSGDRNMHLKQHTVDKPHKCKYCHKGFRLQKSLRAHERIHTGEKPYICEICKMGFISYNALAIHTMKHSDEEKQMVNEKTLSGFKKSIVHNCTQNLNQEVSDETKTTYNCTIEYLDRSILHKPAKT